MQGKGLCLVRHQRNKVWENSVAAGERRAGLCSADKTRSGSLWYECRFLYFYRHTEHANEKLRQRQSFNLHMHLSTLFSPKQKELVLKKAAGKSLNKTEREYYSRVVKKKLEALTNTELRRLATTLTKK